MSGYYCCPAPSGDTMIGHVYTEQGRLVAKTREIEIGDAVANALSLADEFGCDDLEEMRATVGVINGLEEEDVDTDKLLSLAAELKQRDIDPIAVLTLASKGQSRPSGAFITSKAAREDWT